MIRYRLWLHTTYRDFATTGNSECLVSIIKPSYWCSRPASHCVHVRLTTLCFLKIYVNRFDQDILNQLTNPTDLYILRQWTDFKRIVSQFLPIKPHRDNLQSEAIKTYWDGRQVVLIKTYWLNGQFILINIYVVNG